MKLKPGVNLDINFQFKLDTHIFDKKTGNPETEATFQVELWPLFRFKYVNGWGHLNTELLWRGYSQVFRVFADDETRHVWLFKRQWVWKWDYDWRAARRGEKTGSWVRGKPDND